MTRLTRRAEDALLGAALHRPEALPALRWIPPQAFSRPDTQALWHLLHRVDFSQVPRKEIPAAVTRAVQEIPEPGIRKCLSPQRLTQLAGACPNPRNVALYGGMTLEAAMHRSVEQGGERLQDTAQRADVEDARVALEETEHVSRHLQALEGAWKATPETVRNLLDTRPQEPVAPSPPGPRTHGDPHTEFETVASLAWAPNQFADVPWLKAEDFSDPQLRTAYDAMATLHQRQAPIDTLTLAWEASHRGGPQPSEQLLEAIDRYGSGGIAAHTATRVLGAAALDRAADAGRDLRNYGRSPALAPTALVTHAEKALQPCQEDHRRLQHAEREPELADTEPAPRASHDSPAYDHEMEM